MVKQKFLKRAAFALSLLLLLGSLAGCGKTPGKNTSSETDTPSAPSSSQPNQSAPPKESETAFPGTYTVPQGWVKMGKYSTENKIFYVQEGHEDDELPDNISIEVGTNRYSADEHEKFRDAIVRQLAMQLQGLDAKLTGDGTHTKQDYVVYIFTISEAEMVTKQYYIVGDQRYCLLHLTNFTNSESANEAAQAMADSFVWD